MRRGSVQKLSHFQSCDGGSVMLKFHLAQRLHVHILSRAPLRAGDVFQPGRGQAETGLTIGKGPDDPGPSSNFLHQPFQRIVRPDFAPMTVGEAVQPRVSRIFPSTGSAALFNLNVQPP